MRLHRDFRPLADLRSLFSCIVFLVGLATLSGCSETAEPDLLATLPLSWAPIGPQRFGSFGPSNPWNGISIDGDAELEYLLLYAYGVRDVSMADDVLEQAEVQPSQGAPVGAVVFDAQQSSEFVVDSPALATPLQPAAGYIPYRIGPSYWQSPNTGYVGLYRGNDTILIAPYGTNETGLCAADDPESAAKNELTLLDPGRVLTIMWWRGPYRGYGAAQIAAPGGFRNLQYLEPAGLQDLDFSETQAPVWSVDALYPLAKPMNPLDTSFDGGYADPQRSLLCRAHRFYREQALAIDPDDYRADIRFVDDDLGIQFCRSNEVDPFFPEAVVLQFLFGGDETRRSLLSDRLDAAQINRILALSSYFGEIGTRIAQDCQGEAYEVSLRKYRIDRLETRAALGFRASYRLTRPADQLETSRLLSFVCVETVPLESIVDNATERRQLLFFSLIHEPPTARDIDGQTVHYTDRLFIVDVENATDWGYQDCARLIAENGSDLQEETPQ